MKSFVKSFAFLALLLIAGAASAHETAIGHAHPHPALIGGDALIIATLLGLALTAIWMSRRAR